MPLSLAVSASPVYCPFQKRQLVVAGAQQLVSEHRHTHSNSGQVRSEVAPESCCLAAGGCWWVEGLCGVGLLPQRCCYCTRWIAAISESKRLQQQHRRKLCSEHPHTHIFSHRDQQHTREKSRAAHSVAFLYVCWSCWIMAAARTETSNNMRAVGVCEDGMRLHNAVHGMPVLKLQQEIRLSVSAGLKAACSPQPCVPAAPQAQLQPSVTAPNFTWTAWPVCMKTIAIAGVDPECSGNSIPHLFPHQQPP